MLDYSSELNPEQLDAVLRADGPCLVLAGAGSGKTRVITYRVAYLLEQGVNPENILLVTFTNKAADEMMRRVQGLVQRDDQHPPAPLRGGNVLPWAGTFHHIAYKIFRVYAPLLGYTNNFTVLDSDDSETLIKLCAKQFKQEGKKFPSPSILQAIISYSRNAETSIDEVLEARYDQWLFMARVIKAIADEYGQKKKEANAMDFDDLLVNFLNLLCIPERQSVGGWLHSPSPEERGASAVEPGCSPDKVITRQTASGLHSPSAEGTMEPARPARHSPTRNVLTKFANQFNYILVDEYQDTNKIQASIIHKLASIHKNILVVGDDAQSIYSFRAADIQNILQFEKDYPDAKIFKLETNYRSSKEILEIANDVIENNVRQYKKKLKTLSQSGLKPSLHPQMDQSGEAEFIVRKIQEHINSGVPEKEIAVLFRAAHHSQMLEMELVKAGIQYDYRGGLRFFERAHVKDVLAYLRIISNIKDTAAWMRVLMHEEGIGPAGANKIFTVILSASEGSPSTKADPIQGDPSVALGLRQDDMKKILGIGYSILSDKAKNGWKNFSNIFSELLESEKNPSNLIDAVLQSPYRIYLEEEYVDSNERLEDLEQLKIFAEKYHDLEQFLAEATLQESFRTTDNGLQNAKNKIILSTIHQAKGLEWTAVFIINLSSGGFPNDRALREREGLEEERRLFYVAITRAKKHLYLTYPMANGSRLARRSLSEGGGDSAAGPSMFLGEINSDLLDDHSLLSTNSSVFDDDSENVHYIDEDKPLRIKKGSFLRSVEDL